MHLHIFARFKANIVLQIILEHWSIHDVKIHVIFKLKSMCFVSMQSTVNLVNVAVYVKQHLSSLFFTLQLDLGNIVISEVPLEKTTFIPPPWKENSSGCVDWKRTDWSWQKPGLSGSQRSLKLLKEKKPKTIKSITSSNALFWKSLWIQRQYWWIQRWRKPVFDG